MYYLLTDTDKSLLPDEAKNFVHPDLNEWNEGYFKADNSDTLQDIVLQCQRANNKSIIISVVSANNIDAQELVNIHEAYKVIVTKKTNDHWHCKKQANDFLANLISKGVELNTPRIEKEIYIDFSNFIEDLKEAGGQIARFSMLKKIKEYIKEPLTTKQLLILLAKELGIEYRFKSKSKELGAGAIRDKLVNYFEGQNDTIEKVASIPVQAEDKEAIIKKYILDKIKTNGNVLASDVLLKSKKTFGKCPKPIIGELIKDGKIDHQKLDKDILLVSGKKDEVIEVTAVVANEKILKEKKKKDKDLTNRNKIKKADVIGDPKTMLEAVKENAKELFDFILSGKAIDETNAEDIYIQLSHLCLVSGWARKHRDKEIEIVFSVIKGEHEASQAHNTSTTIATKGKSKISKEDLNEIYMQQAREIAQQEKAKMRRRVKEKLKLLQGELLEQYEIE